MYTYIVCRAELIIGMLYSTLFMIVAFICDLELVGYRNLISIWNLLILIVGSSSRHTFNVLFIRFWACHLLQLLPSAATRVRSSASNEIYLTGYDTVQIFRIRCKQTLDKLLRVL